MDTVKNIAVRGFNIYLAQVSSFQQNNTIGGLKMALGQVTGA